MPLSKRRRAERKALSEAPHARQLALMLATQKALRTRLKEAMAREKSPHRLEALKREIANVEYVIGERERELTESLASAEAERAL